MDTLYLLLDICELAEIELTSHVEATEVFISLFWNVGLAFGTLNIYPAQLCQNGYQHIIVHVAMPQWWCQKLPKKYRQIQMEAHH